MPFRTSRSATRQTPVVLNASGKDKDPGDPRHERRAAATAAFGVSDIEAIGRHGSAAAAHSSMRSNGAIWGAHLYHSCTRSENHWLFFIGLLVLFIFCEISAPANNDPRPDPRTTQCGTFCLSVLGTEYEFIHGDGTNALISGARTMIC